MTNSYMHEGKCLVATQDSPALTLIDINTSLNINSEVSAAPALSLMQDSDFIKVAQGTARSPSFAPSDSLGDQDSPKAALGAACSLAPPRFVAGV